MKVYDVEIKVPVEDVHGGWNNPEGMGFATAVVYDSVTNSYRFYSEARLSALIEDLTGEAVLTFNGLRFDNCVVLGNQKGLDPPWQTIDLLHEIICAKYGTLTIPEAVKRVGAKPVFTGMKLDTLVRQTLGSSIVGKLQDSGAEAPKLLAAGKMDLLWEYNLHDVRLNLLLWEFKERHGYVIDGLGKRVPVPRSSEIG